LTQLWLLQGLLLVLLVSLSVSLDVGLHDLICGIHRLFITDDAGHVAL
jgi:hypothetical protein